MFTAGTSLRQTDVRFILLLYGKWNYCHVLNGCRLYVVIQSMPRWQRC